MPAGACRVAGSDTIGARELNPLCQTARADLVAPGCRPPGCRYWESPKVEQASRRFEAAQAGRLRHRNSNFSSTRMPALGCRPPDASPRMPVLGCGPSTAEDVRVAGRRGRVFNVRSSSGKVQKRFFRKNSPTGGGGACNSPENVWNKARRSASNLLRRRLRPPDPGPRKDPRWVRRSSA